MVTIRPEREVDASAIQAVNEAAFGASDEANLVDALRREGFVLLSLVAEAEGRIVGHVLFSRMWIAGATGRLDAVALAPIAVVPERQRQGIGGQLIHRGLEMLRERGERIVVVLGHPDYYPRFGFSSERALALDSPFPRDAFMALELAPGALEGVAGAVKYPPPFGL